MPRKLRAPKARRRRGDVRLSDLDPSEKLSLLAAWAPRPGPWTSTRWQTWDDFLREFSAVEEELREQFVDRLKYLPGSEPFGAAARRYAERHGLAALDGATSYEIHACRSEAQ